MLAGGPRWCVLNSCQCLCRERMLDSVGAFLPLLRSPCASLVLPDCPSAWFSSVSCLCTSGLYSCGQILKPSWAARFGC